MSILKILYYFQKGTTIPLRKWEAKCRVDRLKYYISFYRDCLILYNDRYAAQPKKQKGVLSLGFPKGMLKSNWKCIV